MAKVSDQAIATAAAAAGFPSDQVAIAVAVALAESGGNATATNHNRNGSTDYGLWQINSVHASILAAGNWQVPESNARMAYQVWSNAHKSWSPWNAFKNGSYWKFIGRGTVAAEAVRKGGQAPIDAAKKLAELANGVIGNLGDGGGLPSLPDPLAPVKGLIGVGEKALTALTDRDTWIRFGMLALATLLLIVGAVGALWALGGKGVVRKGARVGVKAAKTVV